MSSYVLVPGGLVGGWIWSGVADRLREAGHHVVVVERLPSVGPGAVGDLAADAGATARTVEGVGEPVVLVGQSYSGMVLTELADHPAIAHSVYVAALWPQRGRSALDVTGATGPPPGWVTLHDDGTVGVVDDLELVRRTLCADVDARHAYPYLRRFEPQSVRSLVAPCTAPDPAHPTTYVICEQDASLAPTTQEEMAAAADHRHRHRLPSSHMPMLSMPDALTDLLRRVH